MVGFAWEAQRRRSCLAPRKRVVVTGVGTSRPGREHQPDANPSSLPRAPSAVRPQHWRYCRLLKRPNGSLETGQQPGDLMGSSLPVRKSSRSNMTAMPHVSEPAEQCISRISGTGGRRRMNRSRRPLPPCLFRPIRSVGGRSGFSRVSCQRVLVRASLWLVGHPRIRGIPSAAWDRGGGVSFRTGASLDGSHPFAATGLILRSSGLTRHRRSAL